MRDTWPPRASRIHATRHHELVQLRLLLTRAEPEAARLGRAHGRRPYAKIQLVSYYCPRSQPACLTFRYIYQGDGSRVVGGN